MNGFVYRIPIGLHSLIDIPYINIKNSNIWYTAKTHHALMIYHTSHNIYKCEIPRGSRYYINEYGEVVSDKLIIKSKI